MCGAILNPVPLHNLSTNMGNMEVVDHSEKVLVLFTVFFIACLTFPHGSRNRPELLTSQGSNIPPEPFVRNFIEGFAKVQKDYIHGPRTVTLTEHILVKVKEVCNTRPTLTETVLARVSVVICLQEVDHPVPDDGLKDFSWDGGQADGSVVPPIREETLFGDGASVRRLKVLGHLYRGQRSGRGAGPRHPLQP